LQNAFDYYFEQLQNHFKLNKSGADLSEFLEKIVGNGIIFTKIVVTNDLDAYKVFESLNARGVKLSTADLLKNYLFKLLHHLGELDLNEAERQWQNMTDTIRTNDLTTYIRQFWNSKNKLERQPSLFKAIKREINTAEKAIHFLNELENATVNKIKDSKSQEALFDFVTQYDNRWKNANSEVSMVAAEYLDCSNKTILLHSNSSVITSFFSKLNDMNVKASIIQTESRPENEGRYQAVKLANLGFEVKYIVDTAASFMMGEADMMITGADQVHKNYFVNKIGTYALALLCREKDIPLYVLADSRKISNTDANPQALHTIQRPGSDIWKSHPEGITPVNFYFEPIPTILVKSFITEKGIKNPTDFTTS